MTTAYRLGISVGVSGRGISGGFLSGAANGFRNAGGQATTGSRGVGAFNKSLTATQRVVEGFRTSTATFAQGLSSVAEHAQRSAVGLRNLALGAGAVGVGLAAALVKSNRDLENQTLAMTGLINANLQFKNARGGLLNQEENFRASMRASNKVIDQMRADAAKGAGNTEERILAFNATLNAVTGAAGGNLQTVRKLANQVVTVSKLSLQLMNDPAQAARDAQAILEGRAQADVNLFQFLKAQLGDAGAFNKLTAPERLERFTKALSGIATPSLIKAQAQSFDGLTSSLGDFAAKLTQVLGGPLFARIRQGLSSILTRLSDSQDTLTIWAQRVGEGIGRGFDLALQFGSRLAAFTQSTIIPIFNQVWPVIQRITSFISDLAQIVAARLTPIVQFFAATFSDGFALVQGWLKDNQPFVNDFVDGLKLTVKWGADLLGWAVGFIGTGLGAVIAGIGVGVMAVFAGFKRLDDFLKQFGFIGLIKGFGAAMLDMKNQILNALDGILLGFLNTIKSIPGADLLGLGGGARDLLGQRMNSRDIATGAAYNAAMPPSGNTTVNVTNHVTTSDPQAAAAAVNRGVGRAVTSAQPGSGKTGAPITMNPILGGIR